MANPADVFLSNPTVSVKRVTVFIVGENLPVLLQVFQSLGVVVSRTCRMLNFERRRVSDEATAMLQSIRRSPPDLLWIQWNEEGRYPRQRPYIRSAVEFLTGLVEQQLQGKRMVLLEGRAMDVPVRDEVFEGVNRLNGLLGEPSHQWWCNLGVVNSRKRPVCGDHLVLASPVWHGKEECGCGRTSSSYAYNRGEGYE